MTKLLVLSLLISIFVGLFASGRLYNKREAGSQVDGPWRYNPSLRVVAILFILVLNGSTGFFLGGSHGAMDGLLAAVFSPVLTLSLYYAILLALLPSLRQRIRPRACATLWLLPSLFYLTRSSFLPRPLLTVHVPKSLLLAMCLVWLAGFLAILGWSIAVHLRFRASILRDAAEVTDPNLLAVWRQELIRLGEVPAAYEGKLVTSPTASTPLSVGLFRSGLRVVLPRRSYTAEELTLIFRHELIHIVRGDTWTKFFLLVCKALCWFNPLMWIAMRRSADDLELSCDEIALQNEPDPVRRQYAELILHTAGNERGFTTCLSASASALRYRLKNILQPRKLRPGALAVSVICFMLLLSRGSITLAYGESTVGDLLFQSRDASQFSLRDVSFSDASSNSISTALSNAFTGQSNTLSGLPHSYYDSLSPTHYTCIDPDALFTYLSALPTQTGTVDYSSAHRGRSLVVSWRNQENPDEILGMILSHRSVQILSSDLVLRSYDLPRDIDWDYLDSLIPSYPGLPATAPTHPGLPATAPTLSVSFRQENDTLPFLDFSLHPETLIAVTDGQPQALREPTADGDAPGIVTDDPPSHAVLAFSYPLVHDFTVTVEPWDGSPGYSVNQKELETPDLLPLAASPAHYTVHTALQGEDGVTYEAQFRFDIRPPEY